MLPAVLLVLFVLAVEGASRARLNSVASRLSNVRQRLVPSVS